MHPLLAHIPIIPHPHRQPRSIAVERKRTDGVAELGVLPQPFLNLVVPDGDGRVGACGGEGVVYGVERERVDGVHLVDVVDGVAVAFEGVFFGLRGGGGVEVFDGDAALDGGGRVPCASIVIQLVNRGEERRDGQEEAGAPWPSDIHARLRVMYFKLLSRCCAGVAMLRIS